MKHPTTFDVLIIGGGQAGIPLAFALAEAGLNTALSERKQLGGSCVNFGCTPTKAALASARVAHLARRASEFGIVVPTVEVDFSAVIARAERLASRSRTGIEQGFAGTTNPLLLRGHTRFTGRGTDGFTLKVGRQEITAAQVVINTGTRSVTPGIDGIASVPIIHAGNWLELRSRPTHIVIIGGGYIGLEMGQFYRRMGSEVTVIQRSGHVLPHEDEDVSERIQDLLEAEGITLLLDSTPIRVESVYHEIQITVARANTETTLLASHLFTATGRMPNTDDLGLDTVGVQTDRHGYIAVDERLATTIDGAWAAGDVRGGPLFTHTSWDDHRILRDQLLGAGSRTTKRIIPYAVFIDPELGRVGLTEREARAQGYSVITSTFEMDRNGKAHEIGETKGFIKLVADGETGRLLGAAVLATEAAELVHTYIALMNTGAPYTVLRDSVHIHPTLNEAIQSATNEL